MEPDTRQGNQVVQGARARDLGAGHVSGAASPPSPTFLA
jgi:hypothetical protein